MFARWCQWHKNGQVTLGHVPASRVVTIHHTSNHRLMLMLMEICYDIFSSHYMFHSVMDTAVGGYAYGNMFWCM